MLYIEYSSRRICDLRCFDVNTLEYGMKKGNTIRSLEKYSTYYLLIHITYITKIQTKQVFFK